MGRNGLCLSLAALRGRDPETGWGGGGEHSLTVDLILWRWRAVREDALGMQYLPM